MTFYPILILPQLKLFLESHDSNAKKFGQNFLIQESSRKKIPCFGNVEGKKYGKLAWFGAMTQHLWKKKRRL